MNVIKNFDTLNLANKVLICIIMQTTTFLHIGLLFIKILL